MADAISAEMGFERELILQKKTWTYAGLTAALPRHRLPGYVTMPTKETVVVLEAHPKPGRYSNQAIQSLVEHGHRVIPIHPVLPLIEGLPVKPDLRHLREKVNTLTLYVSAERGKKLLKDIIELTLTLHTCVEEKGARARQM